MYKPAISAYAISSTPADGTCVVSTLGGIVGPKFHFNPSDPASQEAALRAFDEWATATVIQIQDNLGRRLTDKELRFGVEHAEDQTPFERQQTKATYDAVFAPPDTSDPNPFNRLLAEHKAAKKKERDPKGAMLEEEAEKWEAKQKAAEEKAKRDADPRRTKCREDALATRIAAQFDPTMPASEIRAADFRLRLAKEGDVKLYAHEKNEYQGRQAERLSQLSQPHLDGLAKHREAIRQLSRPFELPAVSIEYEPGESIDPDAEYRRFASTPGTYSHESQPLSNRLQPQEDQQ